MKRVINSENAPKAIGPYSQAIEKNGILFLSGQLPINPQTGKIEETTIEGQTRQVLKNIESILKEAGHSITDIVKCTCLLSDIKNFPGMNNVYAEFFQTHKPARTTFAVKSLPLDALIEIECISIK